MWKVIKSPTWSRPSPSLSPWKALPWMRDCLVGSLSQQGKRVRQEHNELQAVRHRNTSQALVEAFAKNQKELQTVRQGNALQALAETSQHLASSG